MQLPRFAVIYARLSYAPDGSLEKVDRQEGDCRELGDRLAWGICCVYSDNNKSAWKKNRKRADWDAMLKSFEPGAVCPKGNVHDGILIYHGDRLIRQPWDLELLLKLADDRHLPLASPQGTRDLNSEDDRFILRIEAAQACRASADTSRRQRRNNKARAEAGESSSGGNRPFGYGVPTGDVGVTGKPLYDLTQPHPEEFPILREAVDRLLAGQSQGGVVAWLNTVSTTTNGNRWQPSGFKWVLKSPRIAGFIIHEGIEHKAKWPAVVTREEWEDIHALLERSSRDHGYAGREKKYLLTGHATCWSCGRVVWSKPVHGRGEGARQYFCSNPDCEHRVSRNMRLLDEYVIGRTLRRLNEPGFLATVYAGTDEPGLGSEIAALERRKARDAAIFGELADHPDIDTALLAKGLASYDRKIQALRERMQATTRQRLLAKMAGMTRAQWDAEPIDVRSATVRALFTVKILASTRRGPGFDPESVEVERRP